MSDATTRIKTILTADSSNFEAGVKRAQQALGQAEGKFTQSANRIKSSYGQIDSFATKASKALLGYFAVSEIASFGKKILDAADKMQTLSERTGAAASFFSALQPEIENAGGSLDDFASSLNKMNINIAKAAAGDKGAADAFRAIGLSAKSLVGLSVDEQFYKISTAISKLNTVGQQSAAAVGIFGKGVTSILPTLAKGGEALKAFHDEQVRLGLAMSDDTADRLDDLGDSIHTLSLKLLNFSAKALVDTIATLKTLHLQFEALVISMGKAFGLLNREDADLVLKNIGKKMDDAFKPKAKEKLTSAPGGAELFDATASDKAKDNAKKLSEALDKMQREANRGIRDDQLTDLEKKLAQVDDAAKDLAKTYESELTPQEKKQIEAIKEAIKIRDIQAKQIKLADDIGNAFSDAFEKAFDGASKFGDILNDLLKDIEKIALKAAIIEPLKDAFSGIGRSIFNPPSATGSSGFGSIFSSIIDFLPSFATGTSNVPYDMTARIHKGEAIIPRQQAEAMGGSANVTVNVINNTPAQVQTKQGSNGDLTVLIDNAVAKNMSKAGSRTNQALRAQGSRTLVRR